MSVNVTQETMLSGHLPASREEQVLLPNFFPAKHRTTNSKAMITYQVIHCLPLEGGFFNNPRSNV